MAPWNHRGPRCAIPANWLLELRKPHHPAKTPSALPARRSPAATMNAALVDGIRHRTRIEPLWEPLANLLNTANDRDRATSCANNFEICRQFSPDAGNRRPRRQRSRVAEHGQAAAVAVGDVDQVGVPVRIRLAGVTTLLARHIDAEVGRDVIAHLARPEWIRNADGTQSLIIPCLVEQVAGFDPMIEFDHVSRFLRSLRTNEPLFLEIVLIVDAADMIGR